MPRSELKWGSEAYRQYVWVEAQVKLVRVIKAYQRTQGLDAYQDS